MAPFSASAHDKRVTRSVAIEPAGAHVEVMVSLRVPSGPQKTATLAGIDLGHDGLDAAERRMLEAALATRAMTGLALMIGTATVTLEGADLKLRVPAEEDRPIDLIILGRAKLSSGALSLATKAGDGVDLRLLRGTRGVARVSRGAIRDGMVSTVMGVPDRVSWVLAP